MTGIYFDERLAGLGISHGVTSRPQGDMSCPDARNAVFAALGIPSGRIALLKQAHGDKISALTSSRAAENYLKKEKPDEGDAFILSARGFGCAVAVADCAPLFVWDEHGDIIGLAHCGWKGTAAFLPFKLFKAVKKIAGREAVLRAFIGHHIRPCCFETGAEAAAMFRPESAIKKDGRIYVDLGGEITRQLVESGMKKENVMTSALCTACDPARFFSHRRDKTGGRMMAFAFLP